MTAIRVIFDGKAFVPQQPVSLPTDAEAIVIVSHDDPVAESKLADATREYYQSATDDIEDVAWAKATGFESHRAWDED